MNTMTSRISRIITGAALAAMLVAACLACHTGTPAAPEGTEIPVTCEFITRDIGSGNFDALIKAVVIDEVSDVPQVGVGVYFRVRSGPGVMSNEGPIRTDNEGRAESVLLGRGATAGNRVTVDVSSGAATAEIAMDVTQCISTVTLPPRLVYTLTPNPARVNQDVTVDMSDSTDSDCTGGVPESWRVTWGDGDVDTGDFEDDDTVTHRYQAADIPASNRLDVEIRIEDCQGLTDSDTRTLNFEP